MDILDLLKEVFDNIKRTLDVNSIIGVPITKNDISIIPVTKMTLGFAGGGAEIVGKNPHKTSNNPAGAVGGGATIVPIGFIVIDGIDVKFLKTEGGDKWNDCIESVLDLFLR